MAKKTFKFPKSMGVCADQLYKLRADRLAAQKKVDVLEEEEKALKQHIIDTLPKSQLTGASGKIANVKIVPKSVPQIADIEKFYAYIRRTKRTDLLQRRISEGAVQEILDSGKTVPGVITFDFKTVSLTKVG